MVPEYIGITSNRLEHSIAVARKCYMLAKTEYDMSEDEARKMFLMGFIEFPLKPPSLTVDTAVGAVEPPGRYLRK